MKILRDQIGQRVHAIHRLDRPTCGVLLFATNAKTATQMNRMFEERKVEKIYRAIVDGCPERETWTCEEPLRKDDDSPERNAETAFRVLEKIGGRFALIEARPITGRFHQIRRHLLLAGHPVVGDYRYAGIERSNALGAMLGTGTRMLLQAKSLHFTHPVTGEPMIVEVPDDPLFRL